jgi:hypothetical protein
MMIYKGFEYVPDIVEDEDTRRYFHQAQRAGLELINIAGFSHWHSLSREKFELWVDNYIMEQNYE